MTTSHVLCRLFLFSVSLFAMTLPTLSADADWQLWNVEGIDIKLSPNVVCRLEEGFRYRNDLKEFYYQYSDPGMTIRLAPWLRAGGVFRLGFTKSANTWLWELRPYVFINPHHRYCGFTFDHRLRIEWEHQENTENYWRFRYRPMISRNITVFSVPVNVYGYYEMYYSTNLDEITQHRYHLGLNARVITGLKLNLYFMHLTSENSSGWTDKNIVGIGLGVVM